MFHFVWNVVDLISINAELFQIGKVNYLWRNFGQIITLDLQYLQRGEFLIRIQEILHLTIIQKQFLQLFKLPNVMRNEHELVTAHLQNNDIFHSNRYVQGNLIELVIISIKLSHLIVSEMI